VTGNINKLPCRGSLHVISQSPCNINAVRVRRVGIVKAAAAALLILAMSLISSCHAGSESNIIIAGSTSVQPYAEILVDECALIYPEIEIDVQGGGSSAGITAAQSGVADIGMSSRALKENEAGFWVVEIAKDGLAVIINPKNPISNLTSDQIRDIYTTKIGNWSELGGQDAKIHVITREDGSGTRSAFEELVMGENSLITPKAIVQDSNGAVRQLVSDDPNSIGFISLGLVDSTVKALRLNGIEATRENVVKGTYHLFRPFLFVAKTEPSGRTMQFIQFVLSSAGQQLLVHEGLIPE